MELFKKLEEAEIMTSGHFSGENTHLTWVLTNDGTLTIKGKGDLIDIRNDFDNRVYDTDYFGAFHIFNYPWVCCYPWFDCLDLIKAAVFGEGIEGLGVGTFQRYWNLEKIMLPDSLKLLDSWTFYGCTKLKEVTIPANVTEVGDAFDECCNLKKVTCLAKRPPSIMDSIFGNIAKDPMLYVPKGCVDAYQQNACWSKSFKEIKNIL